MAINGGEKRSKPAELERDRGEQPQRLGSLGQRREAARLADMPEREDDQSREKEHR